MRIALLVALAAACAPRADADDPPRWQVEVDARVLDLAFTRRDRLVVLMDGAIALFRVGDGKLERIDERPLATPGTVRLPAGILAAEAGGDTVWVATNRREGAVLYSTESDRLWEVERAAALPWPGVARGLTYRPGTNLLEGEMAEVGPGPFIRVGDGWAIDGDGKFRVQGITAPWKAGSAAVRLGPRRFMTSGAGAPGAHDLQQFLSIAEDGKAAWEWQDVMEVFGTLTALARDNETGKVVGGVAVEGRAFIRILPSDPHAIRIHR